VGRKRDKHPMSPRGEQNQSKVSMAKGGEKSMEENSWSYGAKLAV